MRKKPITNVEIVTLVVVLLVVSLSSFPALGAISCGKLPTPHCIIIPVIQFDFHISMFSALGAANPGTSRIRNISGLFVMVLFKLASHFLKKRCQMCCYQVESFICGLERVL